ncbi:MAG: hypothetical protein DMD77_20675 [Candidatus Rokuibacteriota bacterium]|nr:MAG: hypothetical protein DMD77_20675 [Candidatus Rokubacteria bacterium]
MRKTKITAWAVLAAFAGFLALGPGLASAQSKEPIKVGMIQPLSGPIAAAGSYITNGAKIALDRVNAKGGVLGRPLELIIEDNKSDPAETRNAAEKLIVRDKVPVIIGAWGSSMTLAMMPLAAQHGVPLVVETSSSGKITDPKTPGQKVVSRISPTSELEAVGAGALIRRQHRGRGVRRPGRHGLLCSADQVQGRGRGQRRDHGRRAQGGQDAAADEGAGSQRQGARDGRLGLAGLDRPARGRPRGRGRDVHQLLQSLRLRHGGRSRGEQGLRGRVEEARLALDRDRGRHARLRRGQRGRQGHRERQGADGGQDPRGPQDARGARSLRAQQVRSERAELLQYHRDPGQGRQVLGGGHHAERQIVGDVRRQVAVTLLSTGDTAGAQPGARLLSPHAR